MNAETESPHPSSFKRDLIEALFYLKSFVQSPVQNIKHIPDWNWQVLSFLVVASSALFGALAGVINLRLTSVILGAFVFPFATLLVFSVLVALVYYTALFVFGQQIFIRKLAIICFLSCIPWIVLWPFVDYIPPLKPVAVILCGLLGIVALTENTYLQKKDVTRFISLIVGAFVVFWTINMIRSVQSDKVKKNLITPESLDILEREMQSDAEDLQN